MTNCAEFCAKFIWMTTLLVKAILALSQLIKTIAADNKDEFRRYKGVEVLIDMLETYKSAQVAKALIHVLNGNGNFTNNILFSVHFLFIRNQH